MADIKGPSFEQQAEEGVEPQIEVADGREGGVEMAKTGDFAQKEEKALELAKKLAGPDEKEAEGGVEVEPEDIEQKKELLTSRLVEAALAAGDDVDKAMDVIERAKKYLGKYPGLVDAIHDRWLEERNKGMY